MKFAKLKKRLEKIECAKQDVERLLAKQEANSVTRLQEIQEQNGQIQNQLLLKQQQLDSSTFISVCTLASYIFMILYIIIA